MAWQNVCNHPGCDGRRFRNLENLKKHMEEVHGGYTASDISESGEEAGAAPEPGAEGQESPAPRAEVIDFGESRREREPEQRAPRKSSKLNRELNDKLNDVLELQVRHLLGNKLEPDEEKRLINDRAEVRNALIGFEFNFDERVIKLEHPFFRIVITILLVVLPFVPSLPDMLAKAAAQKAAADKAKNVTSKPAAAQAPKPASVEAPEPVAAPAAAANDAQPARDAAANGMMVEP